MHLNVEPYHPIRQSPSVPTMSVQVLHEQGSGRQNEDVVLRSPGLFGVFDGATSLVEPHDTGNASGGFRAARLAASSFEQCQGSLVQRAEQANSAIRAAQIASGISLDERLQLWSTSLAVVRLKGSSFEYCHTGDSMILLLYTDGSHVVLTPEVDVDGETLQAWKNSPASSQPIHICLAEQIAAVRLQMNTRYGVLNGEPAAMRFLGHGRHSLAGISDIILFTDGLMLPCETPWRPTDWRWFADLYRLGGLHKIRDQVRGLQRQDPECRRFPRFKVHDDIGAVAISFHGVAAPSAGTRLQ
jgi:hypothetical protein